MSIEKILKHPWFKQNKVDLSQSGSWIKNIERYNISGEDQEKFSSYVQETIAESIMPGQDDSDSKLDSTKSSKLSYSSPEELKSVIKPSLILNN